MTGCRRTAAVAVAATEGGVIVAVEAEAAGGDVMIVATRADGHRIAARAGADQAPTRINNVALKVAVAAEAHVGVHAAAGAAHPPPRIVAAAVPAKLATAHVVPSLLVVVC